MAHQFREQAAVSADVFRGSWRPGYVRLHWPIHRTDFAGGWLQHCAGVALEAYRRFSTASGSAIVLAKGFYETQTDSKVGRYQLVYSDGLHRHHAAHRNNLPSVGASLSP